MPQNLLSAEHIALVDQGISAIVASRNAALRPSVMRAVAARISADGQEVTVYLRPSQSEQLLNDIQATGHIAVVFSEPYSHRTLQVKATRAQLRPVKPEDQAVLQRYLAAMQLAVGRVGYGPDFVTAMLEAPPDDLVAIEFTPESAFDQTPGPRAGAPLSAGPTP